MGARGLVLRVGRPLAFVGAYWAAADLTSSFNLESGFSPWYPPAGLALAYLLALGPRAAPTVLAARWINTLLVFPEAWRDEPLDVVLRGIGVVGAYAAGAWVLRRVGLQHARLRELGWFVVVGVAAVPAAAATVVSLLLIVLQGVRFRDAFEVGRTFWLGDAVAIATIVPAALLVLASIRGRAERPRLPLGATERLEAALQGVALIVVPVGALVLVSRSDAGAYLVLALVPVVWVSLRRDVVLTAVGLLVVNVSISAAAGSLLGPGVELAELQAVMLAAAIAALYIAAVTRTNEIAVADLLESEGRFRSLVASMPDLVVRLDETGQVRDASSPGWLHEAGGLRAVTDELEGAWPDLLARAVAAPAPLVHEWRVDGPHGPRWLEARLNPERRADGELDGVVAVVIDRTEAHLGEARLRRDPLTGLGNRLWFLEALERLSSTTTPSASGDPASVAVSVADLDGFAHVNAALGPEAGDEVLRAVAAHLLDVVPPGAAVARLGADEFAVAARVVDPDHAINLGRAVLDATTRRLDQESGELYLTASVGVAVTDPGPEIRDALERATTAVRSARDRGGGCCVAFDDAQRGAAVDRQARQTLLQRALRGEALVLHYQPIVELRSGRVTGLEVLSRLRGSDGQLVSPADFVPLAEETGLDVELGAVVLDGALAQLASWRAGGLARDVTLSVNVTARQLILPGFADHVLSACLRHGVPPSDLALEITETLVITEPAAAVASLRDLRSHGIRAVVDDFGVGYSSISYLRELPVAAVKVDRSFVAGLPEDREVRSIVGLVVGLAESLGLEVTAEGIETDAQLEVITELGCRYGQGYLFARPAPADEVAAHLAAGDVVRAR